MPPAAELDAEEIQLEIAQEGGLYAGVGGAGEEGGLLRASDSPWPENFQDSGGRDMGMGGRGGGLRRICWVDWSRTQAVWNVVCGHCWWITRDETNLGGFVTHPRNLPPWDETSRLIEYIVFQGALFTIPLFFLVSGYLASHTFRSSSAPGSTPNSSRGSSVQRSGKAVSRFLVRRTARIIPPFVLAFAVDLVYRVASGKAGPNLLKDTMFSQIWFLWALFLIQVLLTPWCFAVRLCSQGRHRTVEFAVYTATHAAICIGVSLALERIWDVSAGGRGGWIAALPVASFSVLLFLAAGGEKGNLCRTLAALMAGLGTFLLGLHPMCSLSKCPELQIGNVNLVQAILMIVLLYMCGFVAREVERSATKTLSGMPIHGFALALYLFSSYWPAFTYWGEQYMRNNYWLTTYQETPVYQLGAAHQDPDPAMKGGAGASWAIARMWFWVAANLAFGKTFCDVEFHPFVYRHLNGSSIVIFILHYPFAQTIIKHLKQDQGIEYPSTLLFSTLVCTFVASFLGYLLLASNPFTAFLAGIISYKDAARRVRRLMGGCCEACERSGGRLVVDF